MVTVEELTSITLTPNPVRANAGLMIEAKFTIVKLTWRKALVYRWKKLKAGLWSD